MHARTQGELYQSVFDKYNEERKKHKLRVLRPDQHGGFAAKLLRVKEDMLSETPEAEDVRFEVPVRCRNNSHALSPV